jgi:threonine/homoserine/homoserine lactone efflux protein
MLFITAQTLSAGAGAGLRATAGVCLGYVVHSALAALGVAAIIAASPLLFEALRWLGAAYLLYLASQLIRSALRPGSLSLVAGRGGRGTVRRGFLTAFLNPKGMMIYFAILPQFMQHDGNIALQATVLSAIFIGLCALVYSVLSLAVSVAGRKTGFGDRSRRWFEGLSGGLLILAAGRLATR